MKLALTDTKYEATLPIFKSKYCILFGPENSIAKILKLTKKVPQLILIAGIIDDRLLSKNEMLMYSTSPGIDAARAELLSTLNFAASNLHATLQSHQQNLVTLLDVYAKGESTSNTTDESSNKTDGDKE